MRGDNSDNLPGVPGIGEKTAAKLVTTYGDLETIFEHLDDLPPKQRQNLGEFKDRVFKNREMSLLHLDVECGVEITDLKQGAFDREKMRVLFDQLEFRTLLPRFLDAIGDVAEVSEAETLDVEVVTARDANAAVTAIAAADEGRPGGDRSSVGGRAASRWTHRDRARVRRRRHLHRGRIARRRDDRGRAHDIAR